MDLNWRDGGRFGPVGALSCSQSTFGILIPHLITSSIRTHALQHFF